MKQILVKFNVFVSLKQAISLLMKRKTNHTYEDVGKEMAMTEGQVKYWTLQENARHNREMERYNEGQLAIAARDVATKEGLLPFQQQNLTSQTNLNVKKGEYVDYEKAESVSRTAKNWTGIWDTITGKVEKVRDQVLKLFF